MTPSPSVPSPGICGTKDAEAHLAVLLDQLNTLILRRVGDSTTPEVSVVEDVTVTAVRQPTPFTTTVSEPSLTIVARGLSCIKVDGETHTCHAGQFMVLTCHTPIMSQVSRASREDPFTAVTLQLRAETLADLIFGTGEFTVGQTHPAAGVSDATSHLIDSVVRLIRVSDNPRDTRVLGPLYLREVLWRLLTSELGPLTRGLCRSPASLARVAGAVHWIREHFDEPLKVNDLAAIAEMSPTSLHRHFRAATSMTPIQFQKNIRLHRARTLLLAGAGTAADIGHRVGYESSSQFARDYRRLFGTSPGRDRSRPAAAKTAARSHHRKTPGR